MGARSNIVVQDGDNRVYLYGHWMACAAVQHAAHGLRSDRFDDAAYLARIVFCSMVGRNVDSDIGYGISSTLMDNQFPLLVIDTHHPSSRATGRGRADVWLESETGRKLSRVFSRDEFLEIAERAPTFDPWRPATPDHDCAYSYLLDHEAAEGSDQIEDM